MNNTRCLLACNVNAGIFFAVQLAEKVTALTVEEFVDHCGQYVEKTTQEKMERSLAPGTVLILRDSRRFQLPAGLTLLPLSSLPPELHTLMTDHNVAVPRTNKGSKSVKSPNKRRSREARSRGKAARVTPQGSSVSRAATLTATGPIIKEKTYLDIAKIDPVYRFPVGTELAPGVVVQERPFFMQFLPRWVELVSIPSDDFAAHHADSDERYKYGKQLLSKLQFIRTSVRSEVNPFLSVTYDLPVGTELVLIPDDIQVYSWGPNAPGIEAVVQPDDIILPPAHFLVERPRGSAPPLGLLMGYCEEFERLAYRLRLPPGIEVMHVVASYPLPLGINMMSSKVLRMPNLDHIQSLKSVPPHLRTPVGLVQFSSGQYLGWGAVTMLYPQGWTGREVEDLSARKRDADGVGADADVGGVFATEIESDEKMIASTFNSDAKVYQFVWIDPLDYRLPDGAEILPCSADLVNRFFTAYDGFGRDHRGHSPQMQRSIKRRQSFEEAPAIVRRRSITVIPGGIGQSQSRESNRTPVSDEVVEVVGVPAPSSIAITDVIKLISLPVTIPVPRERFRQNRKKDVTEGEDSEEEDAVVADADDLFVHARISLLLNAQPDQPVVSKAAAIEAGAVTALVVPINEVIPALIPIVDIDAVSVPHTPIVVDNESKDTQTAEPTDNALTSAESRPMTSTTTGSTSLANSRVNTTESPGKVGFDPLQRPTTTRRMTFTSGLMGIEDAKPPDYESLLKCLEQAQSEIDALEVENNAYRTRTTAAQREIDYLKSRLDRVTNNQKSKQEEFKFVRDQITELKGNLAKAYKTIELREIDSFHMKKKLEEKNDRLQVPESYLVHES